MSIDKTWQDGTAFEVDYLFTFLIITDAGNPFSKQGDVSLFDFTCENIDNAGITENDIGFFLSHGNGNDVEYLQSTLLAVISFV